MADPDDGVMVESVPVELPAVWNARVIGEQPDAQYWFEPPEKGEILGTLYVYTKREAVLYRCAAPFETGLPPENSSPGFGNVKTAVLFRKIAAGEKSVRFFIDPTRLLRVAEALGSPDGVEIVLPSPDSSIRSAAQVFGHDKESDAEGVLALRSEFGHAVEVLDPFVRRTFSEVPGPDRGGQDSEPPPNTWALARAARLSRL